MSANMITNDIELLNFEGVTTYIRSDFTSTLITIVTPGTNVNGIIIYSLAYGIDSAATSSFRMMFDTVAPVAWSSGKGIFICSVNPASNIMMPLIIPAGNGIYEQKSVIDVSVTTIEMVYKIL